MLNNLKNRYEEKETKVSDHLWANLEAKLDAEVVVEKAKPVIWYRYAAAAVLLFGLGSLVWLTNTNEKPSPQMAHEENQVIENPINTVENQNSTKDNTKLLPQTQVKQKMAKTMLEEVDKQQTTVVEKQQIAVVESKTIEPTNQGKLEPKKYVSSSDLLFGLEMDKVKTQKSNSAMGVNIPKEGKEEPNLLKPKEIKILGYSIYKKDSITTKQ